MSQEGTPGQVVLTDEEVHEHLKAIVAEAGRDFVYRPPTEAGTSCYYATYSNTDALEDATGPGCLIGQMLFRAGMTLYDLTRLDHVGSVRTLIANRILVVSDRCGDVLARVQEFQDRGMSWGECLDKFERDMAEVLV